MSILEHKKLSFWFTLIQFLYESQRLQKRVIIPKITCAAVAWWHGMDIALARSELEHLQRAACIMITGAMRTTQKKSAGDVLGSANTGNGDRVCSTDDSIPPTEIKSKNLGMGHNRIWAKADKMNSKFSMIKDYVTLRRMFGKYRTVIPTREG